MKNNLKIILYIRWNTKKTYCNLKEFLMTYEIVHNMLLSKKLYKIVLCGIYTVCNVKHRNILKYIGKVYTKILTEVTRQCGNR